MVEPEVAFIRLATCSMEVASYPPSEITDEQIDFIEAATAEVAVLISYRTGRIAVVM
jgi:hypothetical protein